MGKIREWGRRKGRPRGKVFIRILGNLGDENPLEYGGHVVYHVRDPQAGTSWISSEFWFELLEGDDSHTVYQWDIAPDVLQDLNWLTEEDLKALARTWGMTVDEIREAAVSEDPLERADIYEIVGRHFGFDNLDSYPTVYSSEEMAERWPEYA